MAFGPAFASIFAGFAQLPPKRLTEADIMAEAQEQAARIKAKGLVDQARINRVATGSSAILTGIGAAFGKVNAPASTGAEFTTEDPGRTPEYDPTDAATFRMVKGNVPTYWVDGVEYWSVDSVIAY
ncbi:MAG TPA: hypothetical protein VGR57_18925, partial [Ktedonobacterales bacterium]|nr:hypothetical protein [Ktedonobacterales bacterium]